MHRPPSLRRRPGPPLAGAAALWAVALGCGARTELASIDDGRDAATVVAVDAGVSFPTGTFLRCAEGLYGPSGGGAFLNVIGIRGDASLALSQHGASITAEYTDENHRSHTAEFSVVSTTRAALSSGAGAFADTSTLCVQGPGRTASVPAVLTVSTGALTYSAGAVFLALAGSVTDTAAGPCGVQSAPADLWITCWSPQRPVPATTEVSATELPAGSYVCTTQIGSYIRANGNHQYSASGGTGTLSLARSGADVVATYAGDPALSGTLRFGVTSARSAAARPGQRAMAVCELPIVSPPRSPEPAPLDISAGAIQVVGSTVFLSLVGTMASGCTGAEKAVTLICRAR